MANVILLVDDNIADVKLTERALRRIGIIFQVIVVRDGIEALDYLFGTGQYSGRDTSDLPDIVLLDLKMPKIDGLEVIRRVRVDEITKTLPIIVLTSSSEERDVVESYRSGANSYIQKPVDYTEFVDAVKQLGSYWLVLNKLPQSGKEI